MKELANHLKLQDDPLLVQSLPFSYLDQTGKKLQDYPYLLYKITEQTEGMGHQESVSYRDVFTSPGVVDETKVREVRSRNVSANIQITILDELRLSQVWRMTRRAMDWLESESGRSFCCKLGVTPRLVGKASDKTKYENPVREYRVEFEIRLDGTHNARRTIELTATHSVADIVLEEI